MCVNYLCNEGGGEAFKPEIFTLKTAVIVFFFFLLRIHLLV